MAWQKIDVPHGGGRKPLVRYTGKTASITRAARDLLGGPGKTYTLFVELDLRMIGFKADPAGAFTVTTNGVSNPLTRVLESLSVPAGFSALVTKNHDPQVPLQFVFGLPPKTKKDKPE